MKIILRKSRLLKRWFLFLLFGAIFGIAISSDRTDLAEAWANLECPHVEPDVCFINFYVQGPDGWVFAELVAFFDREFKDVDVYEIGEVIITPEL